MRALANDIEVLSLSLCVQWQLEKKTAGALKTGIQSCTEMCFASHVFNGKIVKTMRFSKSRPCSSQKPSYTVHNDEREMNWVLSLKTLISPNCVAAWLHCTLPAYLWSDCQLNNIQIPLTFEPSCDSSVHAVSSVWMVQYTVCLKITCIVCLFFYDSHRLNTSKLSATESNHIEKIEISESDLLQCIFICYSCWRSHEFP